MMAALWFRFGERESKRDRGEIESERECEACGSASTYASSVLTGGAITDGWPPGGGRGLCGVSHDGRRDAALNWPSGRLTEHLQAITTPNPWRFSKNFLNKLCRAT